LTTSATVKFRWYNSLILTRKRADRSAASPHLRSVGLGLAGALIAPGVVASGGRPPDPGQHRRDLGALGGELGGGEKANGAGHIIFSKEE
jgi:hypothetical protein